MKVCLVAESDRGEHAEPVRVQDADAVAQPQERVHRKPRSPPGGRACSLATRRGNTVETGYKVIFSFGY